MTAIAFTTAEIILASTGLVVGLLLGITVYFLARSRLKQRLDAAREAEKAALVQKLEFKEETLAALRRELETAKSGLDSERERNTGLQTEISRLGTRLEAERQAVQEKLELLEKMRESMSDAFAALSSRALKSNTESFLQTAGQLFKGYSDHARSEHDSRSQQLNELITPVKQSLKEVDSKLAELEKGRIEAYSALRQQVEHLAATERQLRDETSKLVNALKKPVVRGRWGEIQLRRVVELAGMLEYCDFAEQVSVTADDRRLRPDLIVNLPGGKNIVVDAKAPLEAYLNALEANDEATRKEFLLQHSRQIRDHINRLSAKAYNEQFASAPEFTVMFLPGETFFAAALEQNPALIEQGVKQGVIVSSPTTLIALLQAVAYGWRQEKIRESALKISELGKELHDRLCNLGSHFARLGRGLQNATDSYNAAMGTLESRVLVTARKFTELGVEGSKKLEEPVRIETVVRKMDGGE